MMGSFRSRVVFLAVMLGILFSSDVLAENRIPTAAPMTTGSCGSQWRCSHAIAIPLGTLSNEKTKAAQVFSIKVGR